MDKGIEYIDGLIAKVLSREATVEELGELEVWMAKAPENRSYVDDAKKVLAQVDDFKKVYKVNTAKAWEKLEARISFQEEHAGQVAEVIPLFRRPVVLRAAAALLLIAMFAVLVTYFLADTRPDPVLVSATRQIVEQKLPDGSQVTVNKNSEIAYVINGKVREVKLKGEAFFEVVHNEEAPFEIVIGDVIIKDIGTSFNVKAVPESNLIEVLVESGEVYFYSTSQKGLNLVKGEKALYDKTTKRFSKLAPNPSENTLSYKSKAFVYKASVLREVLQQINEVYGSSILLKDPRIGNCRLTTMFSNEPLEVVVEIISETFDLEVERSGEKIILSGKPCTE